MKHSLRGWLSLRQPLLFLGILLLIFGTRIFTGIRFVAAVPQGDDADTITWLQRWSQGIHNWGFVFQRHNGHPMELYYLVNLVQFQLNGYWDPRLDFLAYALVHTLYGAVVIATFGSLLTPRDRPWILAFVLFLFAIPFAGYRIAWGLLWPDSAMMAFSLGALYLAVYRGQTWLGIILTLLLTALASVHIAAGCLCGLAIAGLIAFRCILARSFNSKDVLMAAGCLVIFAIQYFSFHSAARAGSLPEAINALLKALAWPVVFISAAGLTTLVPLAGLVFAQIVSPSFRRNNVAFLTGAAVLLFLIAVATGAFRGDNQIQGQPSGRYTDIYLVVPLVCISSLCLLYRESTGYKRLFWGVFTYGWLCLQAVGFSVHIFYRVIPFLTGESGEWIEEHNQILFRELARHTPPEQATESEDDPSLILYPTLLQAAKGEIPMPAMTIPMITGFPLQPGAQGNYLAGGYPPSYRPRPGQIYTGNFTRHPLTSQKLWFISASFTPTTPYLTFDFLVDKRSRFSSYRLPNESVTLVDQTAGTREDLTPKLLHQYPSLFRDWELVYARVIPGHQYRIESYAEPLDPVQWIAFGEPFESGRLTPFIVGLSQSGKLICLLGLGCLMLSFGLNRLARETELEAPAA